MHTIDLILFIVAVLLAGSVLASKASGKLGVPSLLAFIGIGMLIGSDGPGGIHFDDPLMAQAVGVVALSFILFSGGMNTHWEEVRPIVSRGLALATVGVIVTAGIVGAFTHYFLDFSWYESLLLGSIIGSTDAAAVFGVLRGRSIRLPDKVGALLEFESGCNDPIAVFLTIGISSLIVGETSSIASLVPNFVQQMAWGGAMGYATGRLGIWMMQKLRLPFDALYSVLSIAIMLVAYSATNLIGGNGFLAVYLAGLTYGNGTFIQKKGLQKFHDGFAWLMQIAVFLILGLLVFPSKLPPVAIAGVAVAVVLILIARPVGVFLALAASKFDARSKLLVSWAGLRGAVPIVLATYPLLMGVPKAPIIFDIVFFVVLLTSLLQGTTLSWLAGRFAAPIEVNQA